MRSESPGGVVAALCLAFCLLISACDGSVGSSENVRGQASLEVYAQLDAAAAGITQLPSGQVVLGFQPYYSPKIQVALLNADRKSYTPYPSLDWQSCRNADGTWKNDFNQCVDWVLGLHTDSNGILWLLDSAKSTDKAAGRPSTLVPKLVGWDTNANKLFRIIEISPEATITESQLNDFVVDMKNQVIVIADEGVGENSGSVGSKAALVVVDLKTGKSRRLLQGHPSVMPVSDPVRWDQGTATAGSLATFVGVDGIALDKDSQWLYFAPFSAYKMYRIQMRDLLDTTLSPDELGLKVETYADKPYSGGLTIDVQNNLYTSESGERAIGIIPADTRIYSRFVTDSTMIWPDGVTFNSDGFMYTAAAQLTLASFAQADGIGKNKPPYLVFRFRPVSAGTPGF